MFLISAFLLLVSVHSTNSAFASNRLEERSSIKAMAGCYEVTFRFVETFVSDPNYPIRSPEYVEHGLEWIDLDVDTEETIALQHMLAIDGGSMKHWRQEWQYEPTFALEFRGLNTWSTETFIPGSTQGQWIQKVSQVDDSPRYQCVAPWVLWSNGKTSLNYWECQSFAPLPRREYTLRSDYQILDRRNRHVITEDGWVHEQDNRKLRINLDGTTTEIAQEKGINTYRRVDASRCEVARKDWNESKEIWHVIQAMWQHISGRHPVLVFKEKVDGQALWSKLFKLADKNLDSLQTTGTFDAKALRKEAHDTIHQYLLEDSGHL
jgi:hypothetical protein